jgi:hypothetical protein
VGSALESHSKHGGSLSRAAEGGGGCWHAARRHTLYLAQRKTYVLSLQKRLVHHSRSAPRLSPYMSQCPQQVDPISPLAPQKATSNGRAGAYGA